MDRNRVSKALKIIEEAKDIVLVTHEKPDIDGLSSMLALALVLKNKRCLPLIEFIPQNIQFLHGSEKLMLFDDGSDLNCDLLIVLDAHCEKRIPERMRKFIKPKNVIIFDHHYREDCFPFLGCNPISFLFPEEASTTVIIYRFLRVANFLITQEVAENLLAGLYYDTGGFRYENVKGDVFRIAQELLDLGARPAKISQALFQNKSVEEIYLLKYILSKLKFLKNGKICLAYIPVKDYKRFEKAEGSIDIAGFLRDIQGVEISVLIKEIDPGYFKVSLRSMAPQEVLSLAKKFGGGGHKYACGFTYQGKDLRGFLKIFKKELEAFYETYQKRT